MKKAKVLLVIEDALEATAAPAFDFARTLAREHGIPELPARNPPDAVEFLLRVDGSGLALHSLREPKTGLVKVDFTAGPIQQRARDNLRGQHLVRAVGSGLEVLDATAGLGRDAFLLASAGNRLHLLEREPSIHSLLADGLRRAAADPDLAPVIDRMRLHCVDFRDWDEALRYDVVYLDPMFPRPEKRARGKKEMVFLQGLAGAADESGLLARALGCARGRVVVKRPPREPWMDGEEPSFSYRGRVSRYDVYLSRSPDQSRDST